jgi:CRISPR-associated protein Csb1
MDVQLAPVQGSRFQPTGFPELGPVTYRHANSEILLVESAQSMANRLEAVCWDDARDSLVAPLAGLPYIRVVGDEGDSTNSILESHRINSPYILDGKDKTVLNALKKELGTLEKGRVDLRVFARVLLKYDPNSLIHGVFLSRKELAGGRLKLPRMLSAFIEAEQASIVASGGVKLDLIDPQGNSKKGFGHIPFHRDEFTAETITAYFSLDLAQLHGYALPPEAEELLIALCLFKILNFLRGGLRLRTACDLEPLGELGVKRPAGFVLPALGVLAAELPRLIKAVAQHFVHPEITEVRYARA